MTMTTINTKAEAQIRQLIADHTQAICDKNLDQIMVHYAPNLVLFDMKPPLILNGIDACRHMWETSLPYMPTISGMEQQELRITISGDLAIAHWVSRFTGIEPNHPAAQMWLRITAACQRHQGDRLYIHGSPASRMLRSLQRGIKVCVTVTLLDGLVLARSAFHHSMNYRSVVVFGTASLVQDEAQKMEALRAFTEHVIPGRWPEIRLPSRQELQGTLVLALPLEEASAKVRTGPPNDDEADYSLPVWAGVVPLQVTFAQPIRDPCLPNDICSPTYIQSRKELSRDRCGK